MDKQRVAFRKRWNWLTTHTKIINVNGLGGKWYMLLFFFLFFSSLNGLRVQNETEDKGRRKG